MDIIEEIKQHYQKITAKKKFIERKNQKLMILKIVQTLNKDNEDPYQKICAIEAGTGIGKSFAYILAGLVNAKKLQKKLCVSTATIALQEQIIKHDIPLFKELTKMQFSYGLIKGRNNYACLYKLNNILLQKNISELSYKQQKQIETMRQKLQSKEWNGDKESLDFTIPVDIWRAIQSDASFCNRENKHDQCPFYQEKEKSKHWDLVVTNHSLLAADIKIKAGTILPDPEESIYIIDEAHQFPDIFRRSLKQTINIQNTINQIKKYQEHLQQLLQKMRKHNCNINIKLDAITDYLSDFIEYIITNRLCENNENKYQPKINIDNPDIIALNKKIYTEARQQWNQLEAIKQQAVELELIDKKDKSSFINILIEQLFTIKTSIEPFQQQASDNPYAYWITKKANNVFHIHSSPVFVGNAMQQQFWQKSSGVILCSATLSSLETLDYFNKQIGLTAAVEFAKIPSQFNYQNSKLILPKMQNSPNSQAFINEVIDKIYEFTKNQLASLVIFSSYKSMQYAAQQLSKKIDNILMQDGNNSIKIIAEHKRKCSQNQPSVIFGTNSFTEGLNLPNKELTNLIITKIPFAVPSSPLEIAAKEIMEEQNKNAFMELALPEAARKLNQICGRLIRSETDQGRIIILDNRIVKKRYGRQLIKSLPPFTLEITKQ